MAKQINEIKRMQQLAGIIKENQASEQGYWDTESTLDHIKDELKSNNINFNVRPVSDENQVIVDISSLDKSKDDVTLSVQDGIVSINGEEFNLNEDNTLIDIINYIEELL